MIATNGKKDRLLCCGQKTAGGIGSYWRNQGRRNLKTAWMILSPPAFAWLLWTEALNNPGTKGFFAAIGLLIFMCGLIIDAAQIVYAAKYYWKWYKIGNSRYVKWSIKAAMLIWKTASPVVMVWAISTAHPAYPDQTFVAVFTASMLAIFGCLYDAWLLFGKELESLWTHRETNSIGITKRTALRGLGLVAIILNYCKK